MAREPEVDAIFQSFKNALARLEEAVLVEDENDLQRDATIQRFEFTFELLWKLFKRIAKEENLDCFSPKKSFQFAFRSGLITDEKLFSDIMDARNKTSHVYSEETAKQIYVFIKDKVLIAFVDAKEKLEEV